MQLTALQLSANGTSTTDNTTDTLPKTILDTIGESYSKYSSNAVPLSADIIYAQYKNQTVYNLTECYNILLNNNVLAENDTLKVMIITYQAEVNSNVNASTYSSLIDSAQILRNLQTSSSTNSSNTTYETSVMYLIYYTTDEYNSTSGETKTIYNYVLDTSLCSSSDIKMEILIPIYKENIGTFRSLAILENYYDADFFNKTDPFFTDKCLSIQEKETHLDTTPEYRGQYFQNKTYSCESKYQSVANDNSKNCVSKSVNKLGFLVCSCDFSTDLEVTSAYEVDKLNLRYETNLVIINCIDQFKKFEFMTSNYGFLCVIACFIIVVSFSIINIFLSTKSFLLNKFKIIYSNDSASCLFHKVKFEKSDENSNDIEQENNLEAPDVGKPYINSKIAKLSEKSKHKDKKEVVDLNYKRKSVTVNSNTNTERTNSNFTDEIIFPKINQNKANRDANKISQNNNENPTNKLNDAVIYPSKIGNNKPKYQVVMLDLFEEEEEDKTKTNDNNNNRFLTLKENHETNEPKFENVNNINDKEGVEELNITPQENYEAFTKTKFRDLLNDDVDKMFKDNVSKEEYDLEENVDNLYDPNVRYFNENDLYNKNNDEDGEGNKVFNNYVNDNDQEGKDGKQLFRSKVEGSDIEKGEVLERRDSLDSDYLDKIEKNKKINPKNLPIDESKLNLKDLKYCDVPKNTVHDKRSFFTFFCETYLYNHILLNLFFFKSLVLPLFIRVVYFVFCLCLEILFNAILFSDSLIIKRLNDYPKSTNFSYAMVLLGKVILSIVCCVFIRLFLVFLINPSKDVFARFNAIYKTRDCVKMQMAYIKFKKEMCVNYAFQYLLLFLVCVFTFYYCIIFCNIYSASSGVFLFTTILSIVIDLLIVSFIFPIFLSIFRALGKQYPKSWYSSFYRFLCYFSFV